MHLSEDVQLVALSATLRRPEDFVNWISKARKRPGEIVVRKDRHVPLHFGGLTYTKDPADAEFVTLFGTHGPRAGHFDQDKFHKLFVSAADIQKAAQASVCVCVCARARARVCVHLHVARLLTAKLGCRRLRPTTPTLPLRARAAMPSTVQTPSSPQAI